MPTEPHGLAVAAQAPTDANTLVPIVFYAQLLMLVSAKDHAARHSMVRRELGFPDPENPHYDTALGPGPSLEVDPQPASALVKCTCASLSSGVGGGGSAWTPAFAQLERSRTQLLLLFDMGSER